MLHPIIDHESRRHFDETARSFAEEPWHLRTQVLAQRGWIAVPVRKASKLTAEQAEHLARALASISQSLPLAIAVDSVGEYPHAYELPATPEGVHAIIREFFGINFLITSADLQFVVLMTTEDYMVVAGPANLVEQALGCTIAQAQSAFDKNAADPFWRGRLQAVADRYRKLVSG